MMCQDIETGKYVSYEQENMFREKVEIDFCLILDAKEFKLSKVLGNLQAYKLATGDVGQTEQDKASRKHGNNLGALYGDLITQASLTNESNKRKQEDNNVIDQSSSKQRKRGGKRKRKKNKNCSSHYPVPSVVSETLNEPLPLPECFNKDEGAKISSKEESSESSDNETVDFLGLSTGQVAEISSEDNFEHSRSSSNRCFSSKGSSGKLNEKTQPPLTTYLCSRCHRRGHLTEYCTMPQSERENVHQNTSRQADIQDLFLQCRRLKWSKNASCADCGNTSNLAFCFECRLTFCDGHGHLIEHLLNFPTHSKIYSHKLKKLLKCCNSSCNIVDISELMVCPQCLNKIFDKHYSLINATWSERGLVAIANALCCEEHFHWHRMNCYNSSEELLFSRENLRKLNQERNGLLSEFFF